MGYHIYAIGKAIRALFADRVTIITLNLLSPVEVFLAYFFPVTETDTSLQRACFPQRNY